jgi:hypothetical protein
MAGLFDVANAPTEEPEQVVVGDFIQWTRPDLADTYPTATHSLNYVARISSGGNTEIQVAATESNGIYVVTVDSDTSADFVPGVYYWQAEITETASSNRLVVDRGQFEAIVDLDTGGTDPRTHAQVMIDKIESLLEGRADGDVGSYSIQGRSLTKLGIDELLKWRDYYKGERRKELNAERIRRGLPTESTIKVRF